MGRRVYLNRRSGRGREFLGCAAVVVLVALAAALAVFVFLIVKARTSRSVPVRETGERLENVIDAGDAVPAQISCLPEDDRSEGTPYTIAAAAARLLWREVRNSPAVKSNALYDAVAENVVFRYAPSVSEVNAFAAVSHEKSAQVRSPVVYLLGGAVRYSRLIALAVAADADGKVLNRLVASLPKDAYSKLTEEAVARIARANDLEKVLADPQKAKMVDRISSGVLLGILSHEAGHHVLGHCHGEDRSNAEISRNQEREADSFAASVISASPYGVHILEGRLLWFKALAAQEESGGSAREPNMKRRTHPLCRERFENLIRANAEKARSLGLSVK